MNLAEHFGRFSWAMAAKALPMVYGLVMVGVLIPILPVDEHGHYAIIFNLFLFITFLNKSLVLNPMIRFAAIPGRFNISIRSGFYLTLLLYTFIAVLIWFTAPVSASMLRVTVIEIRYVPILMAAILMREFGFCVQQTLYRTRNIFLMESLYFLGSAGGFMLLGFTGRLTTALTALQVNLVAASASSIAALMLGFNGANLWGRINFPDIKRQLRYGLITLWIGLAGSLGFGADVLLLAGFYTPREVAVYNGAKAVYRLFSAVTQAVGMLVMPFASRLASQDRIGELRNLYEKTIGYIAVGFAAMVAGGWLVTDLIYKLILGGAYIDSAPIFRLLIFAAPFEGIYLITGNILYGIGAASTVALVSGIGVAVWLAAAIPGIYIAGVMGGTAGLVLAMVVLGMVSLRIASSRFKTGTKPIIRRLIQNVTNSIRHWIG